MEDIKQVPAPKKSIDKDKLLRMLCVAVVLLVIVGGIGIIQFMRFRAFEGYEVAAETVPGSDVSGYVQGKEMLLTYGHDGAKGIRPDGTVAWEMSYQLDNPQLVWRGNVASVADIDGKSVYIVAENGIPYHYEVVYPIVKHDVAEQGVTAVLLDNGTEDFIQLYDIAGSLRVDINTKTKIDGIPVDIAISSDGKKLVTLYVTFQAEAMVCKVTFYNADEVGKNYVNNIVEQKSYEENRLVYDVGFLNENILYILMEDGFSLYRMTEVPELICEKRFTEEIIDIACVENGIYMITGNSFGERVLKFFDETGEEKRSVKDLPEHETMLATSEEVVFFSPQSMTIYRANGSLKFQDVFHQSIDAVFTAGKNAYFLVDGKRIQTIKLTGKKEDKEN